MACATAICTLFFAVVSNRSVYREHLTTCVKQEEASRGQTEDAIPGSVFLTNTVTKNLLFTELVFVR